jgi:predicted Zn-dependent protease
VPLIAPLRAAGVLLALAAAAQAAPHRPTTDAQVLERLPARATDPAAQELRELRQALAARPDDAGLAVRLAQRYYAEVAAEGDPRYIGYAQAALAPWWDQPEPPPDVRVMRAVLRQFNHGFEPALADLRAVVRQQPDHAEAWSWIAAIQMVQTRYAEAREACRRLRADASTLVVTACIAAADALSGRAVAASQALRRALAGADVSAEERLWALTRLAEIDDRLGRHAEAEASFRAALALGITDGYLQAAYADFLLDRGRPAEVLSLLKGRERSDVLLLRLVIAARAAKAPQLAAWTNDLAARFEAARRRGDSVHEKEEARFALEVTGDAARALPLAVANYEAQREPADARVLLEAALAARQPQAAAPVLKWLDENQVESVRLRALAAQLKGGS